MRCFIAGPSSGIPGFNHKAFDRAEVWLKTSFDIVHNPSLHRREELNVQLDACPNGNFVQDLKWTPTQCANYVKHCFAWDSKKLAASDVIAMLPGWGNNPYASALHAQALMMGLASMSVPQHVVDTPNDWEAEEDVADAGENDNDNPVVAVIVPVGPDSGDREAA